ncbi:hypothetical protein CMT42_14810 [Elizabethkingia anophelis]|uniref:hypothetical protein n=1 Tax=Elizabethkingia anophelis TaxID=1117645 RepID=UPI00099B05E1|nr:hypothetical protein [Elizabethkingia anophelis]MDV3669171.1 hypothetical protein [Elizabethkingia anophelis]MDV3894523.1 hypothetical protein [Elizabethkingia anophelis]MDV3914532.1 hypothetical protein [Elizabethkingia anophelis]MDV3920720.1 hypothetical protein [Elizabethkingia anophelis]MDV3959193.1 hypothetical protein [Elizabethkingia anophelis]
MKKLLLLLLIFFTLSCVKKTQYYKTEELIESDHKLLGNKMEVIVDSFEAKSNIDAIKEGYKRYIISIKIRENEKTAEESGTYKKVRNFSLFSPEGVLIDLNQLSKKQKDSLELNVNQSIEKTFPELKEAKKVQ